MIELGDLFHNEREKTPYRVIRIECPTHGELESCEANLEPDPEDPDVALMYTRCPVCHGIARIAVQRLTEQEAAAVVKGGTKPERT